MNEEDVKTLIRYRLNEANNALADAKYLKDGHRSPQSIVNRLYYAMFYAALALLQKLGKVPSKHTQVIGLFDTEFVLKDVFPKEMSKSFHRAFELRQVSDYKVSRPVTPEVVDELLNQSAEFVEQVSSYMRAHQ